MTAGERIQKDVVSTKVELFDLSPCTLVRRQSELHPACRDRKIVGASRDGEATCSARGAQLHLSWPGHPQNRGQE